MNMTHIAVSGDLSMVRRLFVSVCLLVPLVIGLAAAVLPRFKVDKPGLLALVFLGIGLAAGGRALWRRPAGARRGGVWAVGLAALLMLPFAVIARGFGRVDMLALLFHADFGTKGAGLAGLDSEILKASVALALVVISLALLANLWQLGWRLLAPATLVLLAVNPLTQMLVHRLLVPPPPSDLVAQFHPVTAVTQPAPQPDILLIYLEGTDRRYVDEAAYPGVYAPLHALEPEAITFVNVGQIAGTGWSLAGMVATQCGIPLVPRGLIGWNNFDAVDSFLPAQTCLTDVLAAQGYRMDYIVGADEGFAGIDAFYRTHGIAQPFGMAAMQAMFPADEVAAAKVGWVLDDQMSFQAARQRLPDLLQDQAPFLQIVETIGPHGQLGYLSRRCTQAGRAEKSRSMAAVAQCTIEEAATFIADARSSHVAAGRGRDLRIAVMSDHLNHSADPTDIAPELYQANSVMFIGGPQKGVTIDRPGAMIDIYPSLLDWLGMTAPGTPAGLGRSLLVPEPPSLVARHGIAKLDAMLAGDARLGDRLWSDAPRPALAISPARP